MAKFRHQINLLPNREDTFLLQFLNWALTIGRLLIILVETLALGTFLYRFWLDTQIADLKDKIKNERLIVLSYKDQEAKFRDLQSRLTLLKKIDALSEFSPKILNDIIEMGKGYVTFKNINISKNIIHLESQAGQATYLTAYINALKKHPAIDYISIDKVENRASSAVIAVGISVYLKQAKP